MGDSGTTIVGWRVRFDDCGDVCLDTDDDGRVYTYATRRAALLSAAEFSEAGNARLVRVVRRRREEWRGEVMRGWSGPEGWTFQISGQAGAPIVVGDRVTVRRARAK